MGLGIGNSITGSHDKKKANLPINTEESDSQTEDSSTGD